MAVQGARHLCKQILITVRTWPRGCETGIQHHNCYNCFSPSAHLDLKAKRNDSDPKALRYSYE